MVTLTLSAQWLLEKPLDGRPMRLKLPNKVWNVCRMYVGFRCYLEEFQMSIGIVVMRCED